MQAFQTPELLIMDTLEQSNVYQKAQVMLPLQKIQQLMDIVVTKTQAWMKIGVYLETTMFLFQHLGKLPHTQ